MTYQPFYIVLTTYSDGEQGCSDPQPGTPAGFDNAVDEYSERADEGKDAAIYLCDPAQNAMQDVTKDADATILRRCHAMRIEPPMWMLSADEQARRQREEDPRGAKANDGYDREIERLMERGE